MAKGSIGQYGKINEFEKDKEDWICYVERIILFFEANEIQEESKKKAILLSSVGAETYKVIKNLAIPSKPTEKMFEEIVQLLKEHQTPKPNKITERFKFNTRDRKDGELLSVYLAELRRLTEHCDYRDQLEDMLRDRLVCRIKHERIQQRLLSEGDSLMLQRALDIAHSMESAIHQASMMKSTHSNNSERLEDICKVNYSQNLKCFRCHGKHKSNNFPLKSKECYVCRKKGHIGKACRSKSFKNKRETNLV